MKQPANYRDKILGILKQSFDRSLPAEEIAAQTGISLADLDDEINALIQKGYAITRESGIKLSGLPDILYPWEIKNKLETKFIGQNIEHYMTIDSTNKRALEWAREGAAEGSVVVAEQQSKGRGRFDRHWVSAAGKGLYFTVILRPRFNMGLASQLTLLTGVAVVQAMRKVSGCAAALKWPNDVLIKGRKVCGILAEARTKSTEHPEYVVIGVGMNVNQEADDFLDDFRASSTSLFLETDHKISKCSLLQEFLLELEKHYLNYLEQGYNYLRTVWLENNCTIGRRVEIKTGPGEVVTGEAVDLGLSGGLLIKNEAGIKEYLAGDVSIGSKSFQN